MKAVASSNLAIVDAIRAIAGSPVAQFETVACTVFSAAKSVMHSNNKSAFIALDADAKAYGAGTTEATKAIKALLDSPKMTPAVKQFARVYASVGAALAHMGIPEQVKDCPQGKANQAARDALLDPLAAAYADEFAMYFIDAMGAPAKTEAELAEATAKREAKKAEKEALALAQAAQAEQDAADAELALQATIQAKAQELAGVRVMSIQEMARAVALALRAGTLDADVESDLMDAVQVRETAALLALSMPAFESVEEPAAPIVRTEEEPEYV